MARASCRKRIWKPGSPSRSVCSVLTATSRPSTVSVACQTSPMPPAAIRSSSRYRSPSIWPGTGIEPYLPSKAKRHAAALAVSADAASRPLSAILELWLPLWRVHADTFQPQLQDRGEGPSRAFPRGAGTTVRRRRSGETEPDLCGGDDRFRAAGIGGQRGSHGLQGLRADDVGPGAFGLGAGLIEQVVQVASVSGQGQAPATGVVSVWFSIEQPVGLERGAYLAHRLGGQAGSFGELSDRVDASPDEQQRDRLGGGEVTVPGRAKGGEQGADHAFAACGQQDAQIVVEGGVRWCGLRRGLIALAHVVSLPNLTT